MAKEPNKAELSSPSVQRPRRDKARSSRNLPAYAQRLKIFRMQKGWSQADMASVLNVSQQEVSTLEASGNLHLEHLARLKHHGLDVTQFVDLQVGDEAVETDAVSESLEMFRNLHLRGIVAAFPNRSEGLQAFKRHIEHEEVGIDLTGSSLKGLVTNRDVWDDMVKRVQTVSDLAVNILLTHPSLAVLRAFVEGRRTESIRNEIREAMEDYIPNYLEKLGTGRVQTRVALHPPTIFAVFLRGQRRALINPYTFTTEAYTTTSFIVRDTGEDNCAYRQYYEHHFSQAWENTKHPDRRVSIDIKDYLKREDPLAEPCDSLAKALELFIGANQVWT